MFNNEKIEKDFSSAELVEMSLISIQTLRACKTLGQTFLSEIVAHYGKSGLNKYGRNFSRNSEKELSALHAKYRWYEFYDNPDRLQNDYLAEIESLPKEDLYKLHDYIDSGMLKLNTRTKKGLMQLLHDYETDLLGVILDKRIIFTRLRNVGSQSEAALEELRLNCIRFVNELKAADTV
jgi:hypothetical protein